MELQRVFYMIMAQDMDRAVAFYGDVMGLSVTSKFPRWSEMALDGAIVAIHIGGGGRQNRTSLSFTVGNIESACEEVKAGVGRVVKGPTLEDHVPLKLALVADTEGNVVKLGEYVG